MIILHWLFILLFHECFSLSISKLINHLLSWSLFEFIINLSHIWSKEHNYGRHSPSTILSVVSFVWCLSFTTESLLTVADSVLRQESWTLNKGLEEFKSLIPAYHKKPRSWWPRDPHHSLPLWASDSERESEERRMNLQACFTAARKIINTC